MISAARWWSRKPKLDREIAGIVSTMRENKLRIGRLDLVTKDGEPVVVLIGRAGRADELSRFYDEVCPDPVVKASFDPPVRLG